MSESAERIQQRMDELRCQLTGDVEEVIQSTKRMVDWREYVTRYPWLCVGSVALLGYFAVPKRAEAVRPDMDALLRLAKSNKLVVENGAAARKHGTLLDMLVRYAANAAVRGAVAYFSRPVKESGVRQSAAERGWD